MYYHKLYYFKDQGHAEPIKFLLKYGNIKHDDIEVLSLDEIDESKLIKNKIAIPLKNLPILKIGRNIFSHPVAICNYLGNTIGLAGESKLDALEIESYALFIYDFINEIETITALNEISPQKYETLQSEIIDDIIPSNLQKFEKIVKQNGGHFFKFQLTWVDLYFTALIRYLNIHLIKQGVRLNDRVLRKYKNLEKLYDTIVNLEKSKHFK